MLTYHSLKNFIIIIENLVNEGKFKEAIEKVSSLKKDFIDFLENIHPILGDIENKKISFSVYKILFQTISELALDSDVLYSGTLTENNISRQNLLSILLEKLNLEKDKEWFESANDLLSEMMHFVEYYYEISPNSPNIQPYFLSKEEIKNKINELKQQI